MDPDNIKTDKLLQVLRENYMPTQNITAGEIFFWAKPEEYETPEEH